jgi:hypothetical protein
VVCHNAVAYFHDGIDVCTHGAPDPGQEPVAIDFYNNDIHVVGDDFIEADGGVHNIRVMRNRGVNAAGNGLSGQPVFGGPAYYIRNIVYHVPNGSGFKFHSKPAGLIVYHNTIIAENTLADTFSNGHFRNNLFLGTDTPRRGIAVFANATSYSTFDFNGYRPNHGAAVQYLWISPQNGKLRDYELTAKDGKAYRSLRELTEATGQEAHGLEADYDVFNNLRAPDPTKPHAIYHAADLDFSLRPGGKTVDAGVILPNVNDDFTGRAPDLGAYETGKLVPVYGPRERGTGSFYR